MSSKYYMSDNAKKRAIFTTLFTNDFLLLDAMLTICWNLHRLSITVCLRFLWRLGICTFYTLNINILSSLRLIRAIESNMLWRVIDAYTRARENIRVFLRGSIERIEVIAEILAAQVARSPSSFPVLLPLSISLFLSFVVSPFLHLQKDVSVFVVAHVSANKFISRGDLY